MNRETSNKITRLSFCLSILVMMIHVTNFRVYGIYRGPLYVAESLIESTANFAVPMFFAISGYMFFRNYRPTLAAEKIKKRIRTVFIPWMVWGLIYCLFFFIISHLPLLNNFVNHKTSIISSFLNLFTIKSSTHLWYLRNLMIYIITAPAIYYVIKNRWGYLSYIILMCGCYWLLNDQSFSISMYSLFFFLGGWTAIHLQAETEKAYSIELWKAAVLGLALLTVGIWRINRAPYTFFAYLLGIPLIWITADCLRSSEQTPEFMRTSFFIYVSHVLILETVEKLFWVLLPRNQMGAMADYLLAPVITLGLIYMSEKILKKNSKMWGLLTGKRG